MAPGDAALAAAGGAGEAAAGAVVAPIAWAAGPSAVAEPHPHAPVLDLGLVGPRGTDGGHRQGGAGANVKLRPVSRAGDLVVAEFAVGQRAAVVGADVIDRVPATLDMEQGQHLPVDVHERLARVREITDFDHALKLMHRKPRL